MLEMPPSERQPEVSLTLKAREKAHRLYNEYELRDRVRDERGTIFRKGESNEYHLVESGWSIVVVVEDDGSRTVITQMHEHPDYHNDNTYQQLGELPMSAGTTPTETYHIPVVDPDTGDGWDVEVEAESPRDAMQKASGSTEVHIASSFVQKHLEVGDE